MRSICSGSCSCLVCLDSGPRVQARGSEGSAPQQHIAGQQVLDAAVSQHVQCGRSGSGNRSTVPPARGCQDQLPVMTASTSAARRAP